MQATTSPTKAAQEQLREMTECCICADIFTDPKMLPCIHTFCLKCLQEMALTAKKHPGSNMPCPVCRQEFTIPPEGFAGLQRNFFMDRLVEVANILKPVSDCTRVLCDRCQRHSTPPSDEKSTEIPSADMYCVECCLKLCNRCSKKHKKAPECIAHRLLGFGGQMSLDEILMTLSPKVCAVHSGEKLKIFCSDCKTVVCSLCFIESHRSHNYLQVSKVVSNFRSQMDKNINRLSTSIAANTEKKSRLEMERSELIEKLSTAQSAVLKISKELKELVDRHTATLLKQLETMKQHRLAEINTLLEDLERHTVVLESYTTYANEIKCKGLPSDVCVAAPDLNARAKELSEKQEVLFARQPRPIKPAFQVTELVDIIRGKQMNFGRIEENADYAVNPSLVCTIRPSASEDLGKPVWGVTILGNEMFLVTDTNSTIKVYDVTTFRPTRHRVIDGMDDPWDIRSCPRNKCLYVFNWKPTAFKEIWKICPESMTVAKKWSTGNDAGRLSVTYESNVLLAVHSHNKINEYTANGQLIREIKLQAIAGVRHPWHAVKLTNGHYLFSHGDMDDAQHGVCIVDGHGNVVRSFSEKTGSTLRNLDVPVNLLVDKRGSIMVADHNNGRVMLFSPTLEPQKAIISKSQGLRKPIRLAVDDVHGRLYVVDCEFDFATRKWKEGEVLVMRIS